MMEALFMLMACGVSYYYCLRSGDNDLTALSLSTAITLMVGVGLYLYGRRNSDNILSRRDSFMLVAIVWIIFSVFGMLPYLLYGTVDNLTDAFFEAMSGFTTTGATVLNNINDQPHGILFWRSITQWMGGLGIIVFSFALIPVYELKNTNMFSAEVTGLGVDKLRPKIADTARRLLIIYVLMTLVCFGVFYAGPMNVYDSICHGMTTLATGGFSTHQESIGYFHSPYIEYMCILFMFLGGVNFSLYYYMSIGRPRIMWRNEELKWFFWIVLVFGLLYMCMFYYTRFWAADTSAEQLASLPEGYEETFRASFFHVVSIISTSGFQGMNYDYVLWGSAFYLPTLIIMGIGSCAGSTSGGIKVIRILVCLKNAINEFRLQLHPRAVIPIRYSGNVLPENKVVRALAFLFLYFILLIIGIFVLTLLGMDMETSLGSCVTALSNVGPGMGTTGPATTFADVPEIGKWLLSFFMLVGRLEIFTVLFLFLPDFWKLKT